MRAGVLGGFVVLASAALLAAPGGAASENLAACGSEQHAALRLVAPKTLPVDYRSGAYVEEVGPGYPDAPYYGGDARVSFLPAHKGGRLRHRYAGRWRNDRFLRWPLQFARGDGRARVVLTYTERYEHRKGSSLDCERTITRRVRPIWFPRPHLHVKRRPRVRMRVVTNRHGTSERKVRALVTGRIRRSAHRPVLLRVWEGSSLMGIKRVHARHGRIRTYVRWTEFPSYVPDPIRARGLYPGDVHETWPCDDFRSSGPNDGCHRRLRDPRYQFGG